MILISKQVIKWQTEQSLFDSTNLIWLTNYYYYTRQLYDISFYYVPKELNIDTLINTMKTITSA